MAQGLPALPDDYALVSPHPFSNFSPITEATCSMFQSWLKGWCLSKYTPIWWLTYYVLSFSLHIVKIIVRKRLLLESRTIFRWKWTLKKSPCLSCSILAPLTIRLIITSSLLVWMRSLGYADWPWNSSGRIWRKEVSESPLTGLFQSALVWSVVFHKGHVWAPCSFSSMCPSYLG